MTAPLEALEAETSKAALLLNSLSAQQWVRPTRCAPLTVLEVAVHICRGATRLLEMLAEGPVDQEVERDGVTYFQFDRAAVGQGVVARAQADASGADPQEFASMWSKTWSQAIAHCRDVSGDPVLKGVFGLIRLSEYLRTRVVETTIHMMDIRDALGLQPDPSPQGLEVCADVLRGLLGADMRTMGIDDVRFCLIGTGRAPLGETERSLLGPLADAFPLLG